jgi:hypothetical protein
MDQHAKGLERDLDAEFHNWGYRQGLNSNDRGYSSQDVKICVYQE